MSFVKPTNILIVSATQKEIAPLMNNCVDLELISSNLYSGVFGGKPVTILITGIGYHATIYWLTKVLCENKFDWVINVGIAGSIDKCLKIGETVLVETEQFYDLQIETSSVNKSVFDCKLIAAAEFPFNGGLLQCNYINNFDAFLNIKRVNAITSSTIHGDVERINRIDENYHPAIETMEGAGVFYVCMLENRCFLQLRTISNKVGYRDQENWDIKIAIEKLNENLLELLNKILF